VMLTGLTEDKPMTHIVGATKGLGRYIAWEPSCYDRKDYLLSNLPHGINRDPYLRTFKEDIELDYIVERLQNVDILYITSPVAPRDELYYFRANEYLFHGQKIWSKWHSFVHLLPDIRPSHSIEQPCYFVGTRPNYTHQMVDFLPNLLLRDELTQVVPANAINLIGCQNPILEHCLSFEESKVTVDNQFLELSRMADPCKPLSYNGWHINCISFRELYLVRHLSIFKAFSLLRDTFANALDRVQGLGSSGQDLRNRSIFLARSDDRILNQNQLSSDLSRYHSVTISKQLSSLSMIEKYQYLSDFRTFILPPGSENINALCLASSNSCFIQMIPREFTSLLNSPFYSFAGLRYNLPFLHRTVFWQPSSVGPGINSAIWSLRNMPSMSTLNKDLNL